MEAQAQDANLGRFAEHHAPERNLELVPLVDLGSRYKHALLYIAIKVSTILLTTKQI